LRGRSRGSRSCVAGAWTRKKKKQKNKHLDFFWWGALKFHISPLGLVHFFAHCTLLRNYLDVAMSARIGAPPKVGEWKERTGKDSCIIFSSGRAISKPNHNKDAVRRNARDTFNRWVARVASWGPAVGPPPPLPPPPPPQTSPPQTRCDWSRVCRAVLRRPDRWMRIWEQHEVSPIAVTVAHAATFCGGKSGDGRRFRRLSMRTTARRPAAARGNGPTAHFPSEERRRAAPRHAVLTLGRSRNSAEFGADGARLIQTQKRRRAA